MASVMMERRSVARANSWMQLMSQAGEFVAKNKR